MEKIGLPETVDALRSELVAAMTAGEGQPIQFPLGSVQLEVQVGITKETSGDGKVRLWVLELGAGGSYTHEVIQKLTITLQPPVDLQGRPVKVHRRLERNP